MQLPTRALGMLFLIVLPTCPQGREQGRSMVISQQGIVATSQTLASQAGAQILAHGGSAVDAAIAANAVLSLVEPMMDGPGGDLFVIYYDAKTGQLTGLNASGPAPGALNPEFLTKQGITTMPARGIHTVTVPGAVDGWAKMHARYGRLPWKDLFQSAIAYAEQGFPVTEYIQESWTGDAIPLKGESAKLFAPGGKVPAVGQLFRNPDLARALRLIADQGEQAFYKGEIAQAILKTSRALGGTMTADDLASFSAEWVEPISTVYRGWRVYELPPNGQGIAALQMLNIMETQPAGKGPYDADELHKRIEAMKLAYADLHYDADPRFVKVPVKGLLSKDYARQRAALINPQKANCSAEPGVPMAGETTYLTTVDSEGNIASWIQSVFDHFGSQITVDGMGFVLQNRGASFKLEPGHPNVLAGGKRPFHTIIPAFMEKGDQHIGFGIMGGSNQAMAHAQFVSNIVDYGMNVQQAMDAARFRKASAAGCDVRMENRIPAEARAILTKRGHKVEVLHAYNAAQMGRGQAILFNSTTKTKFAASDPRADGSAEPEPIRP
ncbi:MAG TPA: gamma-glutamyltransferase [Bryobacteraceae bacterium]|nr:gamma-glutamyltransferase [Bryobacteraceae bacterium]